jgi:hypothetical protein
LKKTSIEVEILFESSKSLPAKFNEIQFGKYAISTIPTIKKSFNDTHEHFILRFDDVWKENQMYSNPLEEGEFVLSILSVLFETKIEQIASKLNNVQTSMKKSSWSHLEGSLETQYDLVEMFKKLNSLDIDLLRQYLRSCNVYRTALSLIDNNPTLSFFLLVTAVQSIAGKVIGKTESVNFKEFIIKFLPNALKDEISDEKLLLLLIEEAYEMRCAFTHGGTSISIGSLSADKTNRAYVKHLVGKKEIYSPSLRWFAKVVRAVLTNFLEQQKRANQDDKLSDLAREQGVMNVKTSKSVNSNQLVTTNDLDLDFKP